MKQDWDLDCHWRSRWDAGRGVWVACKSSTRNLAYKFSSLWWMQWFSGVVKMIAPNDDCTTLKHILCIRNWHLACQCHIKLRNASGITFLRHLSALRKSAAAAVSKNNVLSAISFIIIVVSICIDLRGAGKRYKNANLGKVHPYACWIRAQPASFSPLLSPSS